MAKAALIHLVSFLFDFYRFNGKGNLRSVVPSPDQANFIRSRQSVEAALISVAMERVAQWGKQNGIAISPDPPYPSSQSGRYWLEFHLGGLTL